MLFSRYAGNHTAENQDAIYRLPAEILELNIWSSSPPFTAGRVCIHIHSGSKCHWGACSIGDEWTASKGLCPQQAAGSRQQAADTSMCAWSICTPETLFHIYRFRQPLQTPQRRWLISNNNNNDLSYTPLEMCVYHSYIHSVTNQIWLAHSNIVTEHPVSNPDVWYL